MCAHASEREDVGLCVYAVMQDCASVCACVHMYVLDTCLWVVCAWGNVFVTVTGSVFFIVCTCVSAYVSVCVDEGMKVCVHAWLYACGGYLLVCAFVCLHVSRCICAHATILVEVCVIGYM